ncbi:helix-turn-helix domain-containing protein [Solidesulfovibrio sp.]|uniref:helix-turn-helix domain-containing protein n=1 Tax=Solidesulfovibrio sp. TaxID=2910990 RepID=UPI002B218ACD|nr:helix-turn-helix domain-containing protein [Solidesulfovibrio sp.]MEA4856765.1 helix-turn-helix domain-containing protein [Solidesulfovibrio sp.]
MRETSGEVKETYTVQEVAKLLKCSDQPVRKFIRGRALRGVKVGRGWRISHDEVVRLTRLQG